MGNFFFVVLVLFLSSFVCASPPCPLDVIGRVGVNGSNAFLVDSYTVYGALGGYFPTDKLVSLYLGGVILNESMYANYVLDVGMSKNDSYYKSIYGGRTNEVNDLYRKKIVSEGDVFVSSCWDKRVYAPDGSLKYLTDGFLLMGKHFLYKDVLSISYVLVFFVFIFLLFKFAKKPLFKPLIDVKRLVLFLVLAIISFIYHLDFMSMGNLLTYPSLNNYILIILNPFVLLFIAFFDFLGENSLFTLLLGVPYLYLLSLLLNNVLENLGRHKI